MHLSDIFYRKKRALYNKCIILYDVIEIIKDINCCLKNFRQASESNTL